LESLTHNLPIVTMPTSLMRGRHSAAILRMMGISETVAGTVGDYIAIATSIGNDAAKRHDLRKKISDNKHRIFRDGTCVSALEQFLDRVARR
jgi:protein O-GlcNAc transferase